MSADLGRTVLECNCIVMAMPQGTAFVPKCPLHTASPTALAELAAKMQSKGKLAARDIQAPTRPGYTYSGDPNTSASDLIRFMLGDTDIATAYLSDAELAYLFTENNDNALQAAYSGCDAIIAKLARNRDESVGSVSIAFSQQLAGFEKLSALLRRRMAKSGVPFAGGLSRTQKIVERLNTDRVQPSFIRDLDQYPDRPESYTYDSLYAGSRSEALGNNCHGLSVPLGSNSAGKP